MELTPAELAGLKVMRYLLKALQSRGDEHARIVWVWHGEMLQMVDVDKYQVMVQVK